MPLAAPRPRPIVVVDPGDSPASLTARLLAQALPGVLPGWTAAREREVVAAITSDAVVVWLPPFAGDADAVSQALDRAPEARVIAAGVQTVEDLWLAGRGGASGFIHPGEQFLTEIAQAVAAVAEGRRYLSPALVEVALEAIGVAVPPGTSRPIARAYLDGESAAALAGRFGVTTQGVESAVLAEVEALGARSPVDAAARLANGESWAPGGPAVVLAEPEAVYRARLCNAAPAEADLVVIVGPRSSGKTIALGQIASLGEHTMALDPELLGGEHASALGRWLSGLPTGVCITLDDAQHHYGRSGVESALREILAALPDGGRLAVAGTIPPPPSVLAAARRPHVVDGRALSFDPEEAARLGGDRGRAAQVRTGGWAGALRAEIDGRLDPWLGGLLGDADPGILDALLVVAAFPAVEPNMLRGIVLGPATALITDMERAGLLLRDGDVLVVPAALRAWLRKRATDHSPRLAETIGGWVRSAAEPTDPSGTWLSALWLGDHHHAELTVSEHWEKLLTTTSLWSVPAAWAPEDPAPSSALLLTCARLEHASHVAERSPAAIVAAARRRDRSIPPDLAARAIMAAALHLARHDESDQAADVLAIGTGIGNVSPTLRQQLLSLLMRIDQEARGRPTHHASARPVARGRIEIRTCGEVSVTSENVVGIDGPARSRAGMRVGLELLLFLLRYPGSSRATIVERVFDEDPNGSNRLRTLRQRCTVDGASLFVVEGESGLHRVNPAVAVDWDVARILQALGEADAAGLRPEAAALRDEALRLYRGPFAPQLEHFWAVELRATVEVRVIGALEALIQGARRRRDHASVVRYARSHLDLQGVQADPEMVLLYAEALAKTGRTEQALVELVRWVAARRAAGEPEVVSVSRSIARLRRGQEM